MRLTRILWVASDPVPPTYVPLATWGRGAEGGGRIIAPGAYIQNHDPEKSDGRSYSAAVAGRISPALRIRKAAAPKPAGVHFPPYVFVILCGFGRERTGASFPTASPNFRNLGD